MSIFAVLESEVAGKEELEDKRRAHPSEGQGGEGNEVVWAGDVQVYLRHDEIRSERVRPESEGGGEQR